jgi:ZIP family zinc transporter
MTGGEGFAKVMPAALVFPWCLIYFLGLIVFHLHINFKISEGIKSPWQRTTWFRQLHCITFRRIGCWSSFGGVAAGIPEASIAGAVTLAIGIGIQNFPEGIAVSMPLRRMGMSRWKSFMYGQSSALVEPIAAVLGALPLFTTNFTLCFGFAQVP